MLLEVKHLKKIFKTRFSKEETTALVDIDFGVEEGEYIAIMGESGSGKKFKEYDYDIKSYQKDGKEKRVTFMADHNLRKEAYLKLTVNSVKGVTSWEEVKKSEVPKEALKKLNNNS